MRVGAEFEGLALRAGGTAQQWRALNDAADKAVTQALNDIRRVHSYPDVKATARTAKYWASVQPSRLHSAAKTYLSFYDELREVFLGFHSNAMDEASCHSLASNVSCEGAAHTVREQDTDDHADVDVTGEGDVDDDPFGHGFDLV